LSYSLTPIAKIKAAKIMDKKLKRREKIREEVT
jgi:hypothetical protein